MKPLRVIALLIACAGMLSCLSTAGQARTLPPLAEADVVKARKTYGNGLPMTAFTEKTKIAQLTAFVNSLPGKWGVPWYGAPVGKIYFEFYRDGKFVGNFYAGPNFFGRDGGNFFSQTAPRKRIDELSGIVGFDMWTHLHEKKP